MIRLAVHLRTAPENVRAMPLRQVMALLEEVNQWQQYANTTATWSA